MQQEWLPLFPLRVVLFPRTPLPLHIFEDRYKEMIGEAIANQTEFGVVLAADQNIANIGCTAVVERVLDRHKDGRLDILSAGRRRFEIDQLDQEKSYLRAKVDFFDDDEEDSESGELRSNVIEAFRGLPQPGVERWEPHWPDRQLSFQIAQPVKDLEFRQQLLMSRSELDRLRRLAEFLPPYAARQSHIEHVQTVAPRNGHGKHHLPFQS